MKRLTTIQQRGKLNEVYALDAPGSGGASHLYMICRSAPEEKTYRGVTTVPIDSLCMIQMQHGARNKPDSTNGALDCDLLEIVRDRLKAFQDGEFPCRENEYALMHIEEALDG